MCPKFNICTTYPIKVNSIYFWINSTVQLYFENNFIVCFIISFHETLINSWWIVTIVTIVNTAIMYRYGKNDSTNLKDMKDILHQAKPRITIWFKSKRYIKDKLPKVFFSNLLPACTLKYSSRNSMHVLVWTNTNLFTRTIHVQLFFSLFFI